MATRKRARGPRVWILSRSARLYSTKRLVEAARELGALVTVVDPLSCELAWGPRGVSLRLSGEPVELPHVVIPRVGARSARTGLGVLTQLEVLGCALVNTAHGISHARDKLLSAQRLVAAGLPVPATALVRSQRSLQKAVRELGGPPVIVKMPRGSQGVGVMLAQTHDEVEAHAQALWQLGQEVLLQQFVVEAAGADIRALVVGGKLVAAMQRRARDGEFRANVHQGGTVAPLRLGRAERRLAERAAEAMGLGMAGVDLLVSRRGPLVLEVNASPGLRGIEGATGVDVAGAIARHALALCQRAGRAVG
ncbi:MAG: RimK family alpha-L-glutamate ligase [Myxococcota bacterium]